MAVHLHLLDRRYVGCLGVLLPLCCLVIGSPEPAGATTYYTRVDGGTPDRCTGLADAPDPGSGLGRPCAWDHPFRALPPEGTPRIAGGDTLVVGPGAYMMGLGAPATTPCSSDYPYACHMPPVPSGPDPARPTRILGAGWDQGCAHPPELWGTERADMVLNLTGSSNVEVACFVVTDHAGCVEFHSGAVACERDSYPFGPWAVRGLYARDSRSVHLKDLDIHGLASAGIQAGRLTDWTVEDVRVAGNGWVGWDGDIGATTSSNSGSLVFRRFTVEWNGCGETYPGGQPTGCWAQSAGGYGDGFGTAATVGHWLFEDSSFSHNTSDGLDLLYLRQGSSITIRRTVAEGNAGNPIKTNGPAVIENAVLVGNCSFFEGKPFTHFVDNCRALGDSLPVTFRRGDVVTVTNSTLAGEGDCLVTAECDSARSTCNGTELLRMRNNVFVGSTEFLAPDDRSCLTYQETFPQGNAVFDVDYSLVAGVKDDACPGAHHSCGGSPGLVSVALDAFDGHLLTGSPAIDAGTLTGAPAEDFDGLRRDGRPDLGAYEFRQPSPAVPPVVTVQPGSLAVAAGDRASFTAAATGSPTPVVRWQARAITGASWEDVAGARSATFSFTAAAADNGRQFRAVFTNAAGTATTDAATLTVLNAPGPSATVRYLAATLPRPTGRRSGTPSC